MTDQEEATSEKSSVMEVCVFWIVQGSVVIEVRRSKDFAILAIKSYCNDRNRMDQPVLAETDE